MCQFQVGVIASFSNLLENLDLKYSLELNETIVYHHF